MAKLKYVWKERCSWGVGGSDVAARGSKVEGVASCAEEFILYV
jgi:hypothetical protein